MRDIMDTALDDEDRALLAAARETLRKAYVEDRHGVAAAVRTASGHTYTGINIEGCAYGPCAEPIALGAAFTNLDRDIVAMVAVHKRGEAYPVLSPCGNCRQLLLDYSPEATVILIEKGVEVKARVSDLLPGAYHRFGQHPGGSDTDY
jgi:cytidine deaminase